MKTPKLRKITSQLKEFSYPGGIPGITGGIPGIRGGTPGINGGMPINKNFHQKENIQKVKREKLILLICINEDLRMLSCKRP